MDLTQGLSPPLLLWLLLRDRVDCGREAAGVDAAVCACDVGGGREADASAAAAKRVFGGASVRGVAAGAGLDNGGALSCARLVAPWGARCRGVDTDSRCMV
jgi:hypothetical protein